MKVKKIFVLVLLLGLGLFFITGCDNANNGGSVKYELDTSLIEKEMPISEFNLGMIMINKTLANGEHVSVPVDETMITAEDALKLETIGNHEITIYYFNFTEKVTIKLIEDPEGLKTYSLDKTFLPETLYVDDFNLNSLRIKVMEEGKDAIYIPVNESMLSSEDNNKLSKEGIHTITIKYDTFTTTVTLTLNKKVISGDTFYSSNSYYKAANGKRGTELKFALRSIISAGTGRETYNDLKTDIPYTDEDPNRPGNMILIYSGASIRGRWDGASTWNREHVWPQSKGWFTTSGAGSDLQHIRPEEPGLNSKRGNKPFAERGGSGGTFEPRDAVKGDVARIIFYLLTRYSESDSYKITNVASSIEMLLKWNKMDPVDNFERQRNDRAFEKQNNRNPFIDHPEAVELIWGTTRLLNRLEPVVYDIKEIKYIDLNKKKNELAI